jgi:hypothetical protein
VGAIVHELYRELGLDQDPWTPPVQITLRARADSVDANWAVLKQVQCGQLLTIDQSLSYEWAGIYEVMERHLFPASADVGGGSGDGTASTARPGAKGVTT